VNIKSKILLDKRLRFLRAKEAQDYLQLSFVIIVIAIFTAFAIRPSVSTALKLNKQIEEYRKLDKDMSAKITNLRQARENYNRISQYISLIDETIPDSPKEGSLLRNINDTAAKNEVELESIEFIHMEAQNPLNELAVILVLMGEYQNLESFINDLNIFLRLVNIKRLSIEPEIKSDGKYIKTKIEMSAYYIGAN
jgi:Tfp pilus assembly protein PilO